MTALHIRPIDQMNAEWAWLGRSSAARRTLQALAEAEPTVAATGATDLAGLVQFLRKARTPADRDHAALVIQGLLRAGARPASAGPTGGGPGSDPLIARTLLQALIPGLVNVARRMGWGSGGHWSDGGAFFADAVATAWEVITEWAGQDRPYAVLDILSAVRCRLRRQVERHRAGRERTCLGPEADDAIVRHRAHEDTDLDLLARTLDDMAGHGLQPADAAIVYARCILGLTMAELSAMTGHSRRQLSYRHHRAERVLCDG